MKEIERVNEVMVKISGYVNLADEEIRKAQIILKEIPLTPELIVVREHLRNARGLLD